MLHFQVDTICVIALEEEEEICPVYYRDIAFMP